MKRFILSSDSTKTDEEMQKELDAHFAGINAKLSAFQRKRPFATYEDEAYIEHESIEGMYKRYIKYYNENVKESGCGFEPDWDEDDSMYILWKDGTVTTYSIQSSDGTKRIPVEKIDSIIVDGSWGTAYAGKHCEIYNLRETTGYQKYGYKNIEQRYNDFDDIRVDFTV